MTPRGYWSEFRQWQSRRWQAWLTRRIPPTEKLKLGQRNLFILPSRFGWLFLVTAIVILILGNNYQNNLILGLGLWLISIQLVCLLVCHRNLSGLAVMKYSDAEGFCHQALEMAFHIEASRGKQALGLQGYFVNWPGSQHCYFTKQKLNLTLMAPHRGQFHLPRICFESYYPLGLFRCWTLIDFELQALAYPKPLAGFSCPAIAKPGHGDGTIPRVVQEGVNQEFSGIIPYQQGASMSRVAWKSLAAGRGWHQKQFVDEATTQVFLSEKAILRYPREQRLSILADWLVNLTRRNHLVGLELLDANIEPGMGSLHLRNALKLLASTIGDGNHD